MIFKSKEIPTRNLETKRFFDYSKGNINLNFSLRIDVKKDLHTFRELLEQAIKDVDETLNQIK